MSKCKSFTILLLAVALAGCSQAPRDAGAGYQAVVESAPVAAPMAQLPPAAGRIVAVKQDKTRGVLTQRIVLTGDAGALGENAVTVSIDQDAGPADYDGDVGPPSQARIARELGDVFGGVAMQMSETYARNSFGPFGYAVGHPRAGVTCLYAFQWGLAPRQPWLGASIDASSMPREPTSVRVRFCRSTLNEAQMVALISGMQVFPPDSRVAYFDPSLAGREPAADPLTAAGVAPVLTQEKLAPPKPRHRRRRHERAAKGPPAPMPGGFASADAALVPMPEAAEKP